MEQKEKIELFKWLAIISGGIALFVSLLLLINYMQTSSYDPLENGALKTLVERLKDDPNNEALKQDIRQLDLLVRKAYFTNVRQIETGSMILLLASMVLILSLRSYRKIVAAIDPPVEDEIEPAKARIITQRWLSVAGAIILILALAAAFFTTDHLTTYSPEEKEAAGVEETKEVAEEEQIEVVQITPVAETVQEESGPEKAISRSLEKEDTEAGEDVIEKSNEETVKTETTLVAKEEIKAEEMANAFPSEAKLKKEFNAFRGYNGNGVSFHKSIPSSWNVESGENILWNIDLPLGGYNSPIIWEDKLFVTGADEKQRVVYCFNSNTGKLLWEKPVTGIPGSPAKAPKTTEDTGLAAPSIATDGTNIYAIFGTGDIIALDMKGNQLWAKNLGVPDNHYGHSSSLMVLEHRLFVQYDTGKGGLVMALDVSSGDELWKTKRDVSISWASPILAQIDEKWQLILSSEPLVAGYDVEMGKELWQLDCMMGEVGPSPAYANGLVIATNEYAKLIAFEPGPSPKTVWEDDEYLPEVSSPVVSDGLLFVATTYGVLVCYDVHNGNKYWEMEYDNGFYSSPLVADGKVYIADVEGIMHIVNVSREHEVVADIDMGEGVFASPSFSEGRIYIRTKSKLYCIGK